MDIFLTTEFVSEVTSILKNNSYADCEDSLIGSIFTQKIDQIKSTGCKRLGGNADSNPFLRKRIEIAHAGKSGGYRLYFWLFIKEENVYLLFIHPKAGKKGGENLTVEKQKELVNTFKTCKNNGTFIQVEYDNNQNKIIYCSNKKAVF